MIEVHKLCTECASLSRSAHMVKPISVDNLVCNVVNSKLASYYEILYVYDIYEFLAICEMHAIGIENQIRSQKAGARHGKRYG